MQVAMIIAIIEKLMVYGPSAVVAISKAFEQGKPTVEQIKGLAITKDPEDYFLK
jgi:hypothetical protein